MKIVHINSYAVGGAFIAAKRIHEGLVEKGVDSKMLVRDNVPFQSANVIKARPYMNPIKRRLIKYGLIDNQVIKNLKKCPKGSKDFEIFTFAKNDFFLHKHPLVQEADIIHLHWVADFLDFESFFKNVKKPIIWTLHDKNPFQGGFHYSGDVESNPQYASLDREQYKIKQKALSKADNLNVVVLSEWMRAYSLESEILGKYSHYIIPNGISLGEIKYKDKQITKKALGLSLDKPVFTFICDSLTVKRKGFDILLEALNNLDEKIELVAIGNDIGLNLDNNLSIKFTGFINSHAVINDYLSASDAFLLPSREDNLPNVMLESLMSGTPVIAFSTGGMKDVILNNVNGILAKEINSDSYKKAIIQFIENRSQFDSKSIANKAQQDFAIEKSVNEYLNLYKQIL